MKILAVRDLNAQDPLPKPTGTPGVFEGADGKTMPIDTEALEAAHGHGNGD